MVHRCAIFEKEAEAVVRSCLKVKVRSCLKVEWVLDDLGCGILYLFCSLLE